MYSNLSYIFGNRYTQCIRDAKLRHYVRYIAIDKMIEQFDSISLYIILI